MNLKDVLQAFNHNRTVLERVLMRTVDTPRWIRIIPFLDQIAEITNQIEIEATKREKRL
jgi:hypothetical protein